MDKKEAIELLKQALVEIPNLKKLHYNNQKFKLWLNKVDTIIKNVLDNNDYEKFDFVQAKYFPDELEIDRLLLEQDYLPKLSDYEVALESIIQKLEEVRSIKTSPQKVWQWIKSHKIISIIFTTITLIAALITIYQFCIE